MDYCNYYGRMEEVNIKPDKRISKMSADEVIKVILKKECDRLIKENANKWMHFERRFMTEINRISKEIKELNKQIEKALK